MQEQRHPIQLLLEPHKEYIQALLSPHRSGVTYDRFEGVARYEYNQQESWQQANPRNLVTELFRCAQDGLLPDGKEAAIVRRQGKLQYDPMTKGLVANLLRSGRVSKVESFVVYEHEEFSFRIVDGKQHFDHHVELYKAKRGKPITAYAVATLTDGNIQREVVMPEKMDAIRDDVLDRARKPEASPWTKTPEDMMRKTAVRQLSLKSGLGTLASDPNYVLDRPDLAPPVIELKSEQVIDERPDAIVELLGYAEGTQDSTE